MYMKQNKINYESLETQSKRESMAPVNRVFLAEILISLLASTVIVLIAYAICKCIGGLGFDGNGAYNKFIELMENSTFNLLLSQILLFIPSLVYILTHKQRFKSSIRVKLMKPVTVLLVLWFSVMIIPVISFVNALSLLLSKNRIQQSVEGVVNNQNAIVTILVIAVVPAIFEELGSRGVIYSELRRVSKRKGIVLSGLIFGMLHMNINQFMYAAAMGMIMALVYEATDSILSTMLIHFVANGTSVITLLLAGDQVEKVQSKPVTETLAEIAKKSSGPMKKYLEWISTMSDDVAQLMYLLVIALICLFFATIVYIGIAYSSGRLDDVLEIFGIKLRKRKYADRRKQSIYEKELEQQTQSGADDNQAVEAEILPPNKVFTPSLIVAMCICIFFMIFREIR